LLYLYLDGGLGKKYGRAVCTAEMNYTNIDKHWIDQGFNKDNLPALYNGLFWGTFAYLLYEIKLD
jgi:hypothetical protein